ncbi:helix-turn-helix domain-containing protein [Cohnella herbarum]|uniref:Helix-turn-helix transcriptional regulator n=1 Tax=Cohnella herbarum TaxID=2728023 RepID=A0A7Z2ZRB6_9BACL|nr:helix-turn-helix transcriptional regulator [Cohnella herbarum]QJD87877.1 helix-turn-helix transcriptional regulator [Cohnella herbarum]
MSALTQARILAGLSIEEAAREIGIPSGYLSEIENGKRGVSSERADVIASVYQKSKDQIFLPTRYAIREVLSTNSA